MTDTLLTIIAILLGLIVVGLGAAVVWRFFYQLNQRLSTLEAKAQKRWTHSELDQLENALFALGRYKFEQEQARALLENGIAWIAKMKNGGPDNGDGKS